ncbi:MAG: hypothetical protein J5760_02800 [Clostridia bacterium]|nr:hypothetical protein [Clostridia bacterium]
MKKVIVIGCPGSGKSVFSRRLNEMTGIPLYPIDMIFWRADRTTITREELIKRLCGIFEKDEWILDGNYGSTMELRMANCDTVFFLDYPAEVCLNGITERRGTVRPDMPWVESPDDIDEDFVNFVLNYNKVNRPAVLELLAKYADKEIHVFKSRNQADAFLKKLRCETSGGNDMQTETIYIVAGDEMQKLFAAKYPEYKTVPFRDDLSKGSYGGAFFDERVIAERAAVWGVTAEDYAEKMAPVTGLDITKNYVLVFGEDECCKANLRFTADYLKSRGYKGMIEIRIVNEYDLTELKRYYE